MKYIKVIKEFTFPVSLKLVKFAEGTYLVQADDRNGRDEYVARDNSTVTAGVVKENMDYFCEVSESEYNREVIDFSEMKALIEKMSKKHGLSCEDLLKKVCEALDIPLLHFTIDWNQNNVPLTPNVPFQPFNPIIQPYTGGNCPQCLQPAGTPCWSTACPNKLNTIYCSTNTNENK